MHLYIYIFIYMKENKGSRNMRSIQIPRNHDESSIYVISYCLIATYLLGHHHYGFVANDTLGDTNLSFISLIFHFY